MQTMRWIIRCSTNRILGVVRLFRKEQSKRSRRSERAVVLTGTDLVRLESLPGDLVRSRESRRPSPSIALVHVRDRKLKSQQCNRRSRKKGVSALPPPSCALTGNVLLKPTAIVNLVTKGRYVMVSGLWKIVRRLSTKTIKIGRNERNARQSTKLTIIILKFNNAVYESVSKIIFLYLYSAIILTCLSYFFFCLYVLAIRNVWANDA